MDADVAMAASAAAATTRTPFDDDDPEMIESGAPYGAAGSASASNFYHPSQGEYEPSQFSNGGAGYGAYGAGAAGAGAGAAGAAAYHDYYNGGNSQGHYYDNPQGEYLSGQSHGHDPQYSQGHYYDDPAAAAGYGYGMEGGWAVAHQTSPPNPEGMPFASGGEADRRRSSGMPNPYGGAGGSRDDQLLGPNVFADQPPSPDMHTTSGEQDPSPHQSDARLNPSNLQRNDTRASTGSLRDDQDYTRRVLSLAN